MSGPSSSRHAIPFSGMSCRNDRPNPADSLTMTETLSRSRVLQQMSKPSRKRGMSLDGLDGPDQSLENAPAPAPRRTMTMKGPSM